ncbi:MAG: head GIN domain-containing protein [Pseudomonadota bacterium]
MPLFFKSPFSTTKGLVLRELVSRELFTRGIAARDLVAISLITASLFSPIISASSYININGKTYQSNNNGSVSVVNGIVIDGEVVSGGGIKGNQHVINQSKNLTAFNQLQVKLSADIKVIYSRIPKITIIAEENIIPLISLKIKNKRLILSTKSNFWSHKGIKIKLYTQLLEQVYIDGSANLTMDSIDQAKLTLAINGTGDIRISGQVKQLYASIDGAGDMNLNKLQSKFADVSINGSGDIHVYATDKLNAKISGSGDINYRGNPQQLNKSISGSGDIDAD